jgi:hypothetical protein
MHLARALILAGALLPACKSGLDDAGDTDAFTPLADNADLVDVESVSATPPTFDPRTPFDAVVKENVTVLAEDVAVDVGADTLTFHGDPGDLAEGDVLVRGEGDGLARIVTSIEVDGDTTTVHTVPAGLDDVFEQVRIAYAEDLDPASFTVVPAPNVRVRDGKGTGRSAALDGLPCPSGVLQVDFDTVLYDGPEGHAELAGCAALDVGIDWVYECSLLWDNYFRVVPHLTLRGYGRMTSDVALDYPDVPYALFRLQGAPITIPVSGVPVVVTPEFDVNAYFSGHIDGDSDVRLGAGVDIYGGIEYDESRDEPWSFPAAVDFATDLDVYGQAHAAARVIPISTELSLSFWGQVGVWTRLDLPVLDMTFDASARPPGVHATADAYVQLGAGFYAETFGHRWIDAAWPDVVVSEQRRVFDTVIPSYDWSTLEDTTTTVEQLLGGYPARFYGMASEPDEELASTLWTGSASCHYERDFVDEHSVDAPFDESYDLQFVYDAAGLPAHLPALDVYGRPYEGVAAGPWGSSTDDDVTGGSGPTTRTTTFDHGSLGGRSGNAHLAFAWRGGLVATGEEDVRYTLSGDTLEVTIQATFDSRASGDPYALLQTASCTAELRR